MESFDQEATRASLERLLLGWLEDYDASREALGLLRHVTERADEVRSALVEVGAAPPVTLRASGLLRLIDLLTVVALPDGPASRLAVEVIDVCYGEIARLAAPDGSLPASAVGARERLVRGSAFRATWPALSQERARYQAWRQADAARWTWLGAGLVAGHLTAYEERLLERGEVCDLGVLAELTEDPLFDLDLGAPERIAAWVALHEAAVRVGREYVGFDAGAFRADTLRRARAAAGGEADRAACRTWLQGQIAHAPRLWQPGIAVFVEQL